MRIVRAALAAGIAVSAVVVPLATIPSASAYSDITAGQSFIINHIKTEQGFKVSLSHGDFQKINDGVQLHALFDNGMYVLMDKTFVNPMDLSTDYGFDYKVELNFTFNKESFALNTYVVEKSGNKTQIEIDDEVGVIVQLPQDLYGASQATTIKHSGGRIEQLNDEGHIFGVVASNGTYDVEGVSNYIDTPVEKDTYLAKEEAKPAPVIVATTSPVSVKKETEQVVKKEEQEVKESKQVQEAKEVQKPVQKEKQALQPLNKEMQVSSTTPIAKPVQEFNTVKIASDVETPVKSKAPEMIAIVTGGEETEVTLPEQPKGRARENDVENKENQREDIETQGEESTIRNEVPVEAYYRDEEASKSKAKAEIENLTVNAETANPFSEQNTTIDQIVTPKSKIKSSSEEVDKGNPSEEVGEGSKVLLGIVNEKATIQKQKKVEGVFSPENAMTRSEFGVMVATYLNVPSAVLDNPFSDVSDKSVANAVSQLKDKAIMYGVTPTEFAPEAPISRQQAAVVIARALEHKGVDIQSNSDYLPYSDADKISTYAAKAITNLTKLGVLKAAYENQFAPNSFVDKESAANLIASIVKETQSLKSFA